MPCFQIHGSLLLIYIINDTRSELRRKKGKNQIWTNGRIGRMFNGKEKFLLASTFIIVIFYAIFASLYGAEATVIDGVL